MVYLFGIVLTRASFAHSGVSSLCSRRNGRLAGFCFVRARSRLYSDSEILRVLFDLLLRCFVFFLFFLTGFKKFSSSKYFDFSSNAWIIRFFVSLGEKGDDDNCYIIPLKAIKGCLLIMTSSSIVVMNLTYGVVIHPKYLLYTGNRAFFMRHYFLHILLLHN